MIKPIKRKMLKRVAQYKDDVKIAEFDSIAGAARLAGVSRVGISHCLMGKQKTTGGFSWRYA